LTKSADKSDESVIRKPLNWLLKKYGDERWMQMARDRNLPFELLPRACCVKEAAQFIDQNFTFSFVAFWHFL
jgi:hypothetical protein